MTDALRSDRGIAHSRVLVRQDAQFLSPVCRKDGQGSEKKRHQDAQSPPSPLVGIGGDAYRGGLLGKPLCAIFRFRHQDVQTPPSPLVGEGVRGEAYRRGFLRSTCVPSSVSGVRAPNLPLLPLWEKGVGGMRGKRAWKCRTLRIASSPHANARSGAGLHIGVGQGARNRVLRFPAGAVTRQHQFRCHVG